MKIDSFVTSGKFRLDGNEWDVDNNVYILGGKGGCYIVDPAHNAERIYDEVGDRPVRGILLTHAHNDHCELAPEIAEHYGVEVYLHPDDQPLWEESNGDAHYTPLADNQTFTIDGEDVVVFHTPGHSPGCVVLYIKNENALLSGDTLFNGGPGATGRKYSDFDQIVESLRNVIFHLPPATKVLPGHGDQTTVGAEAERIDEYVERGY
ncbi:metallo-beta-lactamase domain protein [Corynebacterium sp. CMW7794]|uniref:MBL fold metallo-hydrolase n=1 Tax=Corynebacterium phoceense TaxID=1686286 RepID=A0A540R990_9CORY|nr:MULTISPECIES: MBL fold metallo-hydrolase [Corynebacterium]KXI19514.1 metallo-beta-lactamase domain protein [Corynebacterium sp. CMW7794]MBF9011019.1 MBL fold metallo-hydrolase [Corynebacterium phoceense]MCQ9331479.1 MBL fold metallo-hydrolase [Corynebacterium phoceense]MCQ9335329.1 MBL fold metallo-hydrolase [Corynebacterium phoceense]MCQ9348749.1 MBL fold metallo-hydrolase [Corynebacterium phoceense]